MGPAGTPGKTAIVPWRNEFVGLMCVEAPDVRFEDVVRIAITGPETKCPIDVTLFDICELGSLQVVSVVSPIPTLVGACVLDNLVRIRISGDLPEYVLVKLSGIRAGRGTVRFPRFNEEQMHKNDAFWDQARG